MTVCGTHPSCKYYSVYTDEPGSITVEMSLTSKQPRTVLLLANGIHLMPRKTYRLLIIYTNIKFILFDEHIIKIKLSKAI